MARMATGALLLLLATSAFAESDSDRIQKKIDGTLWKTFRSAFERMDGEALNSVYADQVLRVTPEGLDVDGRFKRSNLTRFQQNLARGDTIELDFWFDSRHTNPTVSYDVGFYRVRVTPESGDPDNFYGQFHIVLRKIDGRWKIVQDWDTASIGGRPITAEDFDRKAPAEF